MTNDEGATESPVEEIRRVEGELERARSEMLSREKGLLLGMIAIHDGFVRLDRALLDGDPSDDVRQVAGRYGLLRKKVETLLEREGVTRVNSVGQVPNPELHEVVETRECAEGENEGAIVEVEEEAYIFKGDVLRMGKVIVGE